MAMCYRVNEVERHRQRSYRPPAPLFGMSADMQRRKFDESLGGHIRFNTKILESVATKTESSTKNRQMGEHSLASKLLRELCVCEEPCTSVASKSGNALEPGKTQVKRTAEEIARNHAQMLDTLVVDPKLFKGVAKFVPLVKPAFKEVFETIPQLYREHRSAYNCLKSFLEKIELLTQYDIATELVRAFVAAAYSLQGELVFLSKEREVAQDAADKIIEDNKYVICVVVRDIVEPLFLADFKRVKKAELPASKKLEKTGKDDKVFTPASTPLSNPDKGKKLGNTVALRNQAVSYVEEEEELHVIFEFGEEEMGIRACIARIMGGSCAIFVILAVVIVTLFAVTKFG